MKVCEMCNKEMVKRKGESVNSFGRRATCSAECHRALVRKLHDKSMAKVFRS